MASIGEDLRTHIVNSTACQALFTSIAADGCVEQNTIRQQAPSPRIWYQRGSSEEPVDCAGVGGLVESTWDIECHSDDLDQALDLADAVKRRLNGHFGSFGTGRVMGVFVEDHDDDYIPAGVGSEEGLYVAAISARIIFATT